MWGMTKKQFLKRSKKTLNQTGSLLLLVREIMDKETGGNISNEEAFRQIDNIRRSLESIFFEFERINPPSKYVTMHLQILSALVDLQEAINSNSEYLSTANGLGQKTEDKLKKSREQLEEFRKKFHNMANEVNTLLEKR